jgi:hypothetical protein
MTHQRDRIVKRVMHALEEEQDPGALVRAYFEDDRRAVVEAVRETLQVTREHPDPARLEEVVDRELIEALRLPERPAVGLLPALYTGRGRVAAAATGVLAVILGALLLMLL